MAGAMLANGTRHRPSGELGGNAKPWSAAPRKLQSETDTRLRWMGGDQNRNVTLTSESGCPNYANRTLGLIVTNRTLGATALVNTGDHSTTWVASGKFVLHVRLSMGTFLP